MTRTVRVELGKRSYDVRIGDGLLGELGATVAAAPGARQAVIIADATVAGLYGRAAIESITAAGVGATLIEFPVGESHKTLATAGHIFDALFAVAPAIDRDTIIVALGGGVSGDMAGFVAATALRGLRWMQCPTTLLADVDASVGGKTGVDHPAGKNLIGAFHQPFAVLVDVRTLSTLPAEQLSNGLAECVKHGAIRDVAMLEFLEQNAAAILACYSDVMADLLERNVAIKADVVSADERESGVRAHLNYGHTIGHAVETLAGYGAILHGQAVSLGMAAAGQLAVRRGLIDSAYAARIEALLVRLGLPVRLPTVDTDAVLRVVQHDKKNRGGNVRMILPTAPGKVDIFSDITPEAIRHAVEYLRSRDQGQGTRE